MAGIKFNRTGDLMRKHSTPVQLNRTYAIIGYLMYAFFFVLAMIECVVDEVYFHVPLFVFFILAYCSGAFAAIRYELLIEIRVIYVGLVIVAICIIANTVMMQRFDIAFVLRTIIILILNIVWFIHRLQNIYWLHGEAEKQGGAK